MNSRNSKYFDMYHHIKPFWDCECGNKICGYKNKCQKCSKNRNGTIDVEKNEFGDWLCKKCNFFVFKDNIICDNCKKD